MSDASNQKLLRMYMEEAEAPMFLSGFFTSPPENFHNTEKVEIDVIRDDEEIAIAVTDLTVGGRQNETQKWVNKGFTPPVFDEEGTVTAYDLIKRSPGQDPFTDPNFAVNATNQAFRIFRKLERKIRRTIELMAAQVFQTATVDLKDKDGNTLYVLDFGAKATHMVDVATPWAADGTTGDPLGDIEALGTVVRRDGKKQPNKLVLGTVALQRLFANTKVKERLDNRAMQVGQHAPEARGQGATFQGWLWVGHYRYELWMYDGFYRDPQTGLHVPYVNNDHVIMMSEGARLDLSYGAIPMFINPEQRAMPYLPPRMSDSGRGLDLSTNAWVTPDGKHLKVSAATRPLTIPTAIDTFGRLKVT